MAKSKQSVNSNAIETTPMNDENSGTKVSGSPDKIIEQSSNKQAPQPKMTQTALKLEDIDPLLSEQLGKLHDDCMQLSLKYMEVGSDFKKVGELVGSYKSVIDQKLQAIKQLKEQKDKEKNSNKK